MTEDLQTFCPDWISPPGDTIADILEEREWTQTDLAKRLGYTTKHISLLINGKAPITEQTALKLETVLGSSARFWLTREAQYRAKLVPQDAAEDLRNWVSWLDELPVEELMAQGIIPKQDSDAKNQPNLVQEMLRFFRVASPQEWRNYYGIKEAAFRPIQAQPRDVGAILAWLRLGEIEAEKFNTQKYNSGKFETSLRAIRELTVLSPAEFLPQMQQLCQNAGVVFFLVPKLSRSQTSGAARWLNSHKALIQLSLDGKQSDRFWFSFFHEAAHILLHGKKEIFLDNWDEENRLLSKQETESDEWARKFLIPPEFEVELTQLRSKEQIIILAKNLGIHPGIVVGRLQDEGKIPINWMNDLKDSFHSREMGVKNNTLPERILI
ncbi:helix-turn-helix domain-containing protein [Laspinema palackyanum]|uniref:helix-turn-helix domain-containing protein n=1 Tax=Laspinema palackyanum TaxID=3231601 RepID=UPI00345D0234|nr:helix-turn-helix domain-containing protein [Laspinema sp. D2c]